MELNVTQMQEQTRQSAEAAEQSKDSSAGYAASADASRQAAEESKQNIDAQVTGFDNHVAEKVGEAESDIEAARIAANKAIIAQQEQSVNEVARAGIEAISTSQSAAQTATEKAQAADTSEKNAAASETAAKLSEANATKMAEQVAADKEQVANDRTAVENAKQEMTGSVAQIEKNTQGIAELKSELVHVNSNVKFNPVWGANIYVGDELNLAKERIDKAKALSMTEVMICVNFQDDENKDFYHAYKYTETYANICKILEYAYSVGIKVAAIKIHRSPEIDYSSMDFGKYTKGLTALHGYISKSPHRPEYMFVLNENTLTDSSANDGAIIGIINTVQNLGYKCGISMFGSYQYVSKTSIDVLNRLDVIGINYYEVISPKDADTTVGDSISAWTNANVKSHITNIKHYTKKPVWITETGMFDSDKAFYFPADSWMLGLEKGDGKAESIYFEGCFYHLKNSDADKVFGWDIDSMYSDKMIALCKKYM